MPEISAAANERLSIFDCIRRYPTAFHEGGTIPTYRLKGHSITLRWERTILQSRVLVPLAPPNGEGTGSRPPPVATAGAASIAGRRFPENAMTASISSEADDLVQLALGEVSGKLQVVQDRTAPRFVLGVHPTWHVVGADQYALLTEGSPSGPKHLWVTLSDVPSYRNGCSMSFFRVFAELVVEGDVAIAESYVQRRSDAEAFKPYVRERDDEWK